MPMTEITPGANGKDNAGDDPFNLRALREPQKLVQVRQRRLVVPVRRRPNRLAFVRTHPRSEYRVTMPIFRAGKSDSGGDEEMYFVHQSVLAEMDGECRLHSIYTAVGLQGHPPLWTVSLPGDDGREPNNLLVQNPQAAPLALPRWCRPPFD